MQRCFRGILPGAQAGPLDDGGVPQLPQCRLERHSGSDAGGRVSSWPTCGRSTNSRAPIARSPARPSSRTWSSPPISPTAALRSVSSSKPGTEEGVWDFVRTHLRHLPVFVAKDGQAEVIAERQNYLLFDRMVAFHVQRGVTVPLSAAEFYAGLDQRFSERDGMYFLPDQVAEYDKKRMTVREVLQLELFVTDEASAIQWLKQQLTQEAADLPGAPPAVPEGDRRLAEAREAAGTVRMLEQNFLRYDGKGEVPSQIHSYLSTNFKELRNLPKDDDGLRAKGKDRWYVPDPNKAGDLEKLRERALLKEFEEYRHRARSASRCSAWRRCAPGSSRPGRSATMARSSPSRERSPRMCCKKTRSS